MPIFFQPWWLETVCAEGDWEVIYLSDKGNQVSCIFTFYIKKKLGLQVVTNPPLTPYSGFKLLPSFPERGNKLSVEFRALEEIIGRMPSFDYLSLNFPIESNNCIPFIQQGYSQRICYTYRIHPKSEALLFNELKGAIRTDIRKAEKKYYFKKGDSKSDANLLYDLYKTTLLENGVKIPFTAKMFENLYEKIHSKNSGEIKFLENGNGEIVAGILVVEDEESCYYLVGSKKTSLENTGAMTLLLWEAIKECSKKGKIFDFEGSYLTGVEYFFRGFGGQLTSYVGIEKYRNKLIQIGNILLKK